MSDITMCTNASCPSRDTCYRAKATPDPQGQSYADFGDGKAVTKFGKCSVYIECRSYSQEKRLETQTK